MHSIEITTCFLCILVANELIISNFFFCLICDSFVFFEYILLDLLSFSDEIFVNMLYRIKMGNTTNHLSLCVGQSSRKTRQERPVKHKKKSRKKKPDFYLSFISKYVSRPCWPYEYENRLNPSASPPIREISPIRLSSQSRSMHIIKKT